MKLLKLGIAAIAMVVCFIACQKQLDFDTNGISVGTLKKDAGGDCSPSAINGIYEKDSVLTGDNFIDVNVDLTTVGTYEIKSDTVNGFSFKGTGTLGILGNNVVRLYGSGKPLAAGVSTFTITYGSTTCVIDVTVLGPGGSAAIFTLGGSPGSCSGFTLGAGTYNAGQILVAANTVTTNVNVTAPGTYEVGTDTVNGIYFRTTNVFTNAGVQSITLSGFGTPVASGTFTYHLTNIVTTCTFTITVGGGGPPAAYALGGNPGTCTGTTLAGTYQQGLTLTSANTVDIDVTVTTVGSYNLSTIAVNGVTFTGAGTFSTTGAQKVRLTGSGTPTGSGLKTHTINGASTTCSFDITYAAPPPPATFTMSNPGGNCTPATVSGTYTEGVALTASNTVEVEVNVTTAGAFTLNTGAAVNGMTFSKSGVFTVTGVQNVILVGSGTPTVAGTNTFTPQAGATNCTFDITTTAPSDFKYKFRIGATWYEAPCSGLMFTVGSEESLNVFGGGFEMYLRNPTGSVTAGNYSGTSTAGKYVELSYLTAPMFGSFPGTGLTNLSAVITSINTTTRIVQGTFSGTVMFLSNGSIATISDGTFKCDY